MMVHRHECTGCGNLVDYLKREGDLACAECGENYEFAGTVGCVTGTGSSRVILDIEETKRIANSLEMLYYDTKESAYDATDEQAALDAMSIRERGSIEPNPELLESEQ